MYSWLANTQRASIWLVNPWTSLITLLVSQDSNLLLIGQLMLNFQYAIGYPILISFTGLVISSSNPNILLVGQYLDHSRDWSTQYIIGWIGKKFLKRITTLNMKEVHCFQVAELLQQIGCCLSLQLWPIEFLVPSSTQLKVRLKLVGTPPFNDEPKGWLFLKKASAWHKLSIGPRESLALQTDSVLGNNKLNSNYAAGQR